MATWREMTWDGNGQPKLIDQWSSRPNSWNTQCRRMQYRVFGPISNNKSISKLKKTHQKIPPEVRVNQKPERNLRGFAKFSAEARSRWLPNQWGVVATSWNVTRPKGFRVGENPRKCWSSTVTLYRYTIKYANGTALKYWHSCKYQGTAWDRSSCSSSWNDLALCMHRNGSNSRGDQFRPVQNVFR